jgi:Fic family protein
MGPTPLVCFHTLWAAMREAVIENFPAPPESQPSKEVYFEKAAAIYKHDAYNSLSIEGYVVTLELIEKIRDGVFNQDTEESRRQQDAMAAKGYFLAHEAVMRSIARIFDGENPGAVAGRDVQTWYAQLHQPHVDVGIIPAYSLAGYRERRVFIRNSQHVPPPREAVPDATEAFFELLAAEDHPAVRGVLGHFAFVFIHPYSDGNGRIGRFLMNAMLAPGGYPWTIVRVGRRGAYMAALEKASTKGNIVDFARFLAEEMQVDWDTQKN